MGAAGNQLALDEGEPVPPGQRPVFGHCGAAVGHRPVVDGDLLLRLVLEQEALQRPLPGLEGAHAHAKISLFQLPIPNLLVHHPEGLGGLGGDDDAAGVPVDPVAEGGGKGVLHPGAPLPLLVEVGLNVVDEGVHLFRLVGVYHHAGRLVHQQQVLILIENVQPGLEEGEKGVLLGGLLKELVVDIELQHISHLEPGVPFGPLAVELDPLDADIFLRQVGGKQGHGLAHPAIQPLPGVIFSDGELPHSLSSRSRCRVPL